LLAERAQDTYLGADNTGAVELCRDRKSYHRSRHVDWRYFKVREYFFDKVLRVEHVPTADNPADLLTKALPFESFAKHAATLLGMSV